VQFEQQFPGDPGTVRARVSSLAASIDNFATNLAAIQPVPDRFLAAHDDLIAKLRGTAQVLRDYDSITTEAAFNAWSPRYTAARDAVNAAFVTYQRVTGIVIPNLRPN
jgi:hypothetical protein